MYLSVRSQSDRALDGLAQQTESGSGSGLRKLFARLQTAADSLKSRASGARRSVAEIRQRIVERSPTDWRNSRGVALRENQNLKCEKALCQKSDLRRTFETRLSSSEIKNYSEQNGTAVIH